MAIRGLLSKPLFQKAPAAKQPWQRVPKINLLGGQRAAFTSFTFMRWVLAAAIVIVAGVDYAVYNGRSDAEDKTVTVQAELADVRRDISSVEIPVNEVKSQLNDENERRNRTAKPATLVKEARIDWASALTRLHSVAVPGVEPGPIATQKDGVINTEGTAASVQAMEAYQNLLRRTGGNLRLVSLNWTAAEETTQGVTKTVVRYTAVFSVQKEAPRS